MSGPIWGSIGGAIEDQVDLYTNLVTHRVTNVSALINMSAEILQSGDLAYVYDEEGSNGLFKYTTSTLSDDGGIIIERTATGGGYWVRLVNDAPINAKWFGAKGNGVNDDTTSLQAAIDAAIANGCGVLIIPRGTYKLSSGGLEVNGTITIRGQGKCGTILKMYSTNEPILTTATNANVSNRLRIENIAFDCDSQTGSQGLVVYGSHGYQRIWVNKCCFLNLVGEGIYTENVSEYTVKDCRFINYGIPQGSIGISIYNSANHVRILGCTFDYIYDAIKCDGNSSGEYNISNILIKNCLIDQHWYQLDYTNEGTSTGLSSTSVTDTGFSTITDGDYVVRIMPERVSNTGFSDAGKFYFEDTGKNFDTSGVKRGDIIVVDQTTDVMAFVKSVISNTKLEIEGWLVRDSYVPTSSPSSTNYKIYGLYFGISSTGSTGTQINVDRWQDLWGNTAVINTDIQSGDRYEVCVKRPNIPIFLSEKVSNVTIAENRMSRGFNAQIYIDAGSNGVCRGVFILSNFIGGGQNDGILTQGEECIINGNTISDQGQNGIKTLEASQTIVTENNIIGFQTVNNTSKACAGIYMEDSSHTLVGNNIINGTSADYESIAKADKGITVDGSSSTSVDNLIRSNMLLNLDAEPIYFINDAGKTVIDENFGAQIEVDNTVSNTPDLELSISGTADTNSLSDLDTATLGSSFRRTGGTNGKLFIKTSAGASGWTAV